MHETRRGERRGDERRRVASVTVASAHVRGAKRCEAHLLGSGGGRGGGRRGGGRGREGGRRRRARRRGRRRGRCAPVRRRADRRVVLVLVLVLVRVHCELDARAAAHRTHLGVLQQQRHAREALAALLAVVFLHVRVRLQVCAQVRAVRERAPAELAAERLLACVSVSTNIVAIVLQASRQCFQTNLSNQD